MKIRRLKAKVNRWLHSEVTALDGILLGVLFSIILWAAIIF